MTTPKLLPILDAPLPQLNLRLATLKVAHGELGQAETSENWSPRIKQYLAEANIPHPAFWCAAFTNWCAQQAASALGVYSPLEEVADNLEGYVQAYYQWAEKKELVVPASEVKPGDLFLIWSPTKRRFAHIGFVYEPLKDHYTTIEGNSNTNGSHNGTAVVSNPRVYFKSTKFVRWTREVRPK